MQVLFAAAERGFLTKLKRRYAPTLLTDEDRENLSKYNVLEFMGRAINEVYRILRGRKIRFIKRYKRRKRN